MSPTKYRGAALLSAGFVLLAALTLVMVILFRGVHFQPVAPKTSQQDISQTMDVNSAKDRAELADRLTEFGRLALAQELASRVLRNLSPAQAQDYAQARRMLLDSLASQLDSDATLFDQDLGQSTRVLPPRRCDWSLQCKSFRRFKPVRISRTTYINPDPLLERFLPRTTPPRPRPSRN